MLLLAGVFAILRYYDAPSNLRLAVAALISALAFVVKPGSVFTALGAFMAALFLQERSFAERQVYFSVLVSNNFMEVVGLTIEAALPVPLRPVRSYDDYAAPH